MLIDTGVGNDKERPYFREFTHLDTDFLHRLALAGVRPEDVDIVINTHVHPDHTGWNTRLEGRAWIPTFPNATYHFARADVEYWNPINGHNPHGKLLNQNVFEDSIDPIIQADLAQIWDGETLSIDENITLVAANGHTPGSSIVSVQSGGDGALFIGDSPLPDAGDQPHAQELLRRGSRRSSALACTGDGPRR